MYMVCVRACVREMEGREEGQRETETEAERPRLPVCSHVYRLTYMPCW